MKLNTHTIEQYQIHIIVNSTAPFTVTKKAITVPANWLFLEGK